MTERKTFQQENLSLDKVLVLLNYFLDFRKFKNRALAEKIGYSEIYLINVRKGRKDSTEKLLKALENFFLLDNLNQIISIDSKIDSLNREKVVLKAATLEKFYAERQAPPVTKSTDVSLNDQISSGEVTKDPALDLLDTAADILSKGPGSHTVPIVLTNAPGGQPKHDARVRTKTPRAASGQHHKSK